MSISNEDIFAAITAVTAAVGELKSSFDEHKAISDARISNHGEGTISVITLAPKVVSEIVTEEISNNIDDEIISVREVEAQFPAIQVGENNFKSTAEALEALAIIPEDTVYPPAATIKIPEPAPEIIEDIPFKIFICSDDLSFSSGEETIPLGYSYTEGTESTTSQLDAGLFLKSGDEPRIACLETPRFFDPGRWKIDVRNAFIDVPISTYRLPSRPFHFNLEHVSEEVSGERYFELDTLSRLFTIPVELEIPAHLISYPSRRTDIFSRGRFRVNCDKRYRT